MYVLPNNFWNKSFLFTCTFKVHRSYTSSRGMLEIVAVELKSLSREMTSSVLFSFADNARPPEQSCNLVFADEFRFISTMRPITSMINIISTNTVAVSTI